MEIHTLSADLAAAIESYERLAAEYERLRAELSNRGGGLLGGIGQLVVGIVGTALGGPLLGAALAGGLGAAANGGGAGGGGALGRVQRGVRGGVDAGGACPPERGFDRPRG